MAPTDPVAAGDDTRPSPLVVIGVSAVIVSTFLPWVQLDGGSMTAWQLPVRFLVGWRDDLGGPKVAPLLLLVLLAFTPLVTKQRLHWLGLAGLAGLVVEALGFTFFRVQALADSPTLGPGALVALIGAALFAAQAFMDTGRR